MYNRRITQGIKGNSLRSHIPLTNEQMLQVAPSIFATEPYHDRSERYAFTNTFNKIEVLRTEGFEPFFVAQSRARIQDKQGHTKHMVRLRRPGAIEAEVADEIVLVNDSSGMTSDIVMFGLFRGVCQNGLVAGEIVNEMRIPHRGTRANDNVIEGVYHVLNQSERVQESMEGMRSSLLTYEEQVGFAAEALKLRWDEGEAPIHAQQLLTVKRPSDRDPNLWNVMNRVQEHLIRGGVEGRNRSNNRTTTRAVGSVNEQVRINRQLWDLAEDFRQFRESRKAAA